MRPPALGASTEMATVCYPANRTVTLAFAAVAKDQGVGPAIFRPSGGNRKGGGERQALGTLLHAIPAH